MGRRCFAFALGLLIVFTFVPAQSRTQLEIRVWTQFVSALKEGRLTEDRIRPYDELRQIAPAGLMLKFLGIMKDKATWNEWETAPEIHRLGDTVHYLVPLTFDGHKGLFCFTFLLQDDGQWFFRHMESITVRLDRIGALPTSKFPDVSEGQKAWMREERKQQAQVDLFNWMLRERGRDFALKWFQDGAGYFLEAKTWVPFVPPTMAFILYLCWEQSNLLGNPVTLEKLNEAEAVVRLEPIYLKLHAQTSIGQKIDGEDYRAIFEAQWQDRALSAGWNLNINYAGLQCIFRFTRR